MADETTDKVSYSHSEYEKYKPIWNKCRIVLDGEESVKEAGELLLPKLTGQEANDGSYKRYKKRAMFYEGAVRVLQSLQGELFRKAPIMNAPKKEEGFFDALCFPRSSFLTFLRKISYEVLAVGRVGVLVDSSFKGDSVYVTMYTTESIINWRTDIVEGIPKLSLVVLLETFLKHNEYESVPHYRLRELRLVDGVYTQKLYEATDKVVSTDFQTYTYNKVEGFPKAIRKGDATFDYIPFWFITEYGNDYTVRRPPLLSVINANIAHYVNSADLEHALHYVAIPTPYVTGVSPDEMSDGLKLGGESLLKIPVADSKLGYLEVSGKGIGALENSLEAKELRMIVLGSRVLELQKKASESVENQGMRKVGETSILSTMASSISEVMTMVVKVISEWTGTSPEDSKKFLIELNKDYSSILPNANTIQILWDLKDAGIISSETLFFNLKKAGIFPDGVSFDDEVEKIDNQPFNSAGTDDEKEDLDVNGL